MITRFLNIFKHKQDKKKLIIVDGDSVLSDFWVFEDVLGSSEVYVVRHTQENFRPPKCLNKYPEVIDVPLIGYRTSKETVDKYIGVIAQKAVSEGYFDINIISRDCDMIDIAKMIVDVNTKHKFIVNVVMPNIKYIAKGTDLGQYSNGLAKMNVYLVKQKNTNI